MATSLHPVFQIPELLETILLHLSINELLLIQRISRHFKTTIQASNILQQALFFRPLPLSSPSFFNPLLKSLFPPFFSLRRKYQGMSVEDLQSLDWWADDVRREKFMREEASWRKMMPVQPGVKVEAVRSTGGCYCIGASPRWGIIRPSLESMQDGGIRMGNMWSLVIGLLDSEHEGTVRLIWHYFGVKLDYADGWQDGMSLPEEWPLPMEGEEDDEREAVQSGPGGTLIVMPKKRNSITLDFEHSKTCYPPSPTISGLQIGNWDEDIIQFEDEEEVKEQKRKKEEYLEGRERSKREYEMAASGEKEEGEDDEGMNDEQCKQLEEEREAEDERNVLEWVEEDQVAVESRIC